MNETQMQPEEVLEVLALEGWNAYEFDSEVRKALEDHMEKGTIKPEDIDEATRKYEKRLVETALAQLRCCGPKKLMLRGIYGDPQTVEEILWQGIEDGHVTSEEVEDAKRMYYASQALLLIPSHGLDGLPPQYKDALNWALKKGRYWQEEVRRRQEEYEKSSARSALEHIPVSGVDGLIPEERESLQRGLEQGHITQREIDEKEREHEELKDKAIRHLKGLYTPKDDGEKLAIGEILRKEERITDKEFDENYGKPSPFWDSWQEI